MRRSLKKALIEGGHLSEKVLRAHKLDSLAGDLELGEELVDREIVDASVVLELRSDILGVPSVRIDAYKIDPEIIGIVPEDLARRCSVIPLFHIGNDLTLAMADPADVMVMDEIRDQTGCNLIPILALRRDIHRAISVYHSVDNTLGNLAQRALLTEVAVETQVDESTLDLEDAAEESSPVVGIVNLVLLQAVRSKASDIHIEPDDEGLRVRYRIDGRLAERFMLPFSLHAALISRIKVLADLDLAQKRLPQDGRISAKADANRIDLRVSSLPTIKGEKIVIRLLDKSTSLISLGQLGLPSQVAADWKEIIAQPNGLVLVTGPTGSGKTTTLYSSLHEINSLDRNIVTVEDPVEFDLPIINQVQVQAKAGLNFAAALRSILRQDPDVVMLGEIRDVETASIALRAALTGHLVLSTLHTNDAASVATRLIDMGVEPYLLASALKGVIAQRLVRRLCPDCLEDATIDRSHFPADFVERVEQMGIQPRMGRGCRACSGSGYLGRTTIVELLKVDDEIEGAITRQLPATVLAAMARSKGMVGLFEDGLEKVQQGITSLDQVLMATRVTEEAPEASGPESTMEPVIVGNPAS